MNWTAIAFLLRSRLSFCFQPLSMSALVLSCVAVTANAGNTQHESVATAMTGSLAHITVLPTETVRANGLPKVATASPVKVARKTGKARGKKIIAPIMQGFAELRNPVALFVAAKNHLLSATHFRRSDSTLASSPNAALEIAPINVRFESVQSYQLTIPSSTAMGRLANAMEDDLHPGIAPNRPPPLVRNSATQLNMRVNDAVSFLWEVDRNESPVDSEVGMGIGFKVAF